MLSEKSYCNFQNRKDLSENSFRNQVKIFKGFEKK